MSAADDVRAMAGVMRESIREMVASFEAQTGMSVHRIEINRARINLTQTVIVSVEIDIRVEP